MKSKYGVKNSSIKDVAELIESAGVSINDTHRCTYTSENAVLKGNNDITCGDEDVMEMKIGDDKNASEGEINGKDDSEQSSIKREHYRNYADLNIFVINMLKKCVMERIFWGEFCDCLLSIEAICWNC